MAKLKDWDVVGVGGVKAYGDEGEIVAVFENKTIAYVRFTPQNVLAIDGLDCTVYIKPESRTIEVSINRRNG